MSVSQARHPDLSNDVPTRRRRTFVRFAQGLAQKSFRFAQGLTQKFVRFAQGLARRSVRFAQGLAQSPVCANERPK
jgi:hypothetical protein